jgi:hypothetical protein
MKSEERHAEQLEVKRLRQFYENPNPLKFETEIVWNYDPAIFPFVRAYRITARGRQLPVTFGESRRIVVGFAVHSPDARLWHGKSYRRYFYIFSGDFDVLYADGTLIARCFAVDPLTVAPTVRGWQTVRCRTAPTPEQRAAFGEIFGTKQAKLDTRRRRATERQRRHRMLINNWRA